MKNATSISCPQCSHEFNPEEAISSRIEQNLKIKYAEQANQLHQQHEARRLELELEKDHIAQMREQQEKLVQEQVAQERILLETKLKAELSQNFSNDIELLKEEKVQMEQKLQAQQQNELKLLRKQRELETKERELDLVTERRISAMKSELEESIRKAEYERIELKIQEKDRQAEMKLREKEVQIENMNRLIEEMKRKSEQGSMQLQGEVQEIALEESLESMFPFDQVTPVPKGVKGADAIQTVCGQYGETFGTIIYESKRTKAFGGDWIEKFKADARAAKADIMVLVTEVLPKGMDHYGLYEGVWVCRYSELIPLVLVLRDCLIRIASATASQENKGTKMQMLYDYLTSNEFSNQFAAVAESISSLRGGIVKERIQMEKLWKEREKQLDKSLINITGMYGSVKGIAGAAVQDIDLLSQDEANATLQEAKALLE
jgi:hypothetical protein